MPKSLAAVMSDEGIGGKLKSWPERVKTFYNDVRTEMKHVTAPSLKDVRATTVVVIITVFIFGFYFWVVDNTIGRGITSLIQYLVHR